MLYPRKLLFQGVMPLEQPPPPPPATPTDPPNMQNSEDQSSFDANVIMVLAVLLCALISALGLNAIIRCAFRCSTRFIVQHSPIGGVQCSSSGGVKRKTLRSMATIVYSDGMVLPGSGPGPECIICLSEFATGEMVKLLPKCNHGFHAGCIDKWLAAHSSCPTCRRSMSSGGSQKEFRCADEVAIISPLDHEGALYNYRGRD